MRYKQTYKMKKQNFMCPSIAELVNEEVEEMKTTSVRHSRLLLLLRADSLAHSRLIHYNFSSSCGNSGQCVCLPRRCSGFKSQSLTGIFF